MSARSLSPRAVLLLRLIAAYTERDASGSTRYWVPRKDTQYVTVNGAPVAIDVGGSGDAAILRSLIRGGFTEQPKRGRILSEFAAAITAKGREELERLSWPSPKCSP